MSLRRGRMSLRCRCDRRVMRYSHRECGRTNTCRSNLVATHLRLNRGRRGCMRGLSRRRMGHRGRRRMRRSRRRRHSGDRHRRRRWRLLRSRSRVAYGSHLPRNVATCENVRHAIEIIDRHVHQRRTVARRSDLFIRRRRHNGQRRRRGREVAPALIDDRCFRPFPRTTGSFSSASLRSSSRRDRVFPGTRKRITRHALPRTCS